MIINKKEYNRIHQQNWRLNNKDRSRKTQNKSTKRYRQKNKIKVNIRRKLAYAIKIGRIKCSPCQICNNLNSQAHHPDYTKPLEIIWLCPLHHKQLESLDK